MGLKRKHIVRVISQTLRGFTAGEMGMQAVALSFFTTMAFVPFLAVIFAISNKVGLGAYLKDLLYQNFGHEEILNYLLGFAENIIATSRQGIYGVVSFIIFLWMVIWLMICIEKAFNKIWKVGKSRVLWKRMLVYGTTMVASPFIIIIFLSVSLTIADGLNLLGMEIPLFGSVSGILVWAAFFLFVVIVLTCIYIFVPNAKVRFMPAFSSAAVAGAAFTVIQYMYLETQVFVSRMNSIYGIFAAVPLFMVWLNIGWFIVLMGSELSHSLQSLTSCTESVK